MYDHYREANRLIFSLENIGHADIAETLREILEGERQDLKFLWA